jgi:cytochrome P450
LLSALIRVEEEGEQLTSEELIHFVSFLFIAGYHTTTNLIGNGVLALLRNPESLALLRREPALLEPAIEELLRFDSPVHFIARIAREDLVVDGHQIRSGQLLNLMIGAANRDPAVFQAPDRLDLARTNAREHLAFGGGAHFFIGAPLARLEGAIAIGTLLSRFGHLELAGEPDWFPNVNLRGMRSLPLACAAN